MILHRVNRAIHHPQPFDRAVVQIEVRHLHVARQRFGIDRKAVVLRRDLDLSGLEKFHRMIRAAVAELQLEGLAAEREPENLMAEADAEDRLVGLRQVARVLDGVVDRRRIARAVAQENAVHVRRPARLSQASTRETRAPRSRRSTSRRRMFHLMPKSYAATRSGRFECDLRRQRKIGPHFREVLARCRPARRTAPRT